MAANNSRPPWLQPPPIAPAQNKLGVIEDDMEYDEKLIHYTYATQHDDVHFLEYRSLHRLNIFGLQNRLAKLKGNCLDKNSVSDEESIAIEDTLRRYTQAIKDYAYTQSLPSLPPSQSASRRRDLSHAFFEIAELRGDPFNSLYRTLAPTPSPSPPSDPLRNTLKALLPRCLTYTKTEMDRRMDEYLQNLPPETVSPFVDKLARFVIAIAGGVALVVPMLIMALPRTGRGKSLVTVSVAVTLFAGVMSLGVRANNMETLVATATYAAVLVVFVGASG